MTVHRPARTHGPTLVRRCMPNLKAAVRTLRVSHGVPIRRIRPEALSPLLPDIKPEVVKSLCDPFEQSSA